MTYHTSVCSMCFCRWWVCEFLLMDEDEDDVFETDTQYWRSSIREIKQEERGTQTPGQPPARLNGMLPCGVSEEPRRLFYGKLRRHKWICYSLPSLSSPCGMWYPWPLQILLPVCTQSLCNSNGCTQGLFCWQVAWPWTHVHRQSFNLTVCCICVRLQLAKLEFLFLVALYNNQELLSVILQ